LASEKDATDSLSQTQKMPGPYQVIDPVTGAIDPRLFDDPIRQTGLFLSNAVAIALNPNVGLKGKIEPIRAIVQFVHDELLPKAEEDARNTQE